MKRKFLMAKLAEAGFTFKEGGNHTKAYKDGVYVTAVPRHTEIPERMVERIARQTNLKLK